MLEGEAKKLAEREVLVATSSQALSPESSCSRRSKSTAAPSDGVRAREMLGWGSPSSIQREWHGSKVGLIFDPLDAVDVVKSKNVIEVSDDNAEGLNSQLHSAELRMVFKQIQKVTKEKQEL